MRKERTGQMSLEMIIGLLILLVVAVVVIRTFLGSMEKMESINAYKKTIEWKNFISECEKACEEYISYGKTSRGVKFCSHRFANIGADVNKNGFVDKFDPEDVGATKMLPLCEDGIFCFHVVRCGTETKHIDWSDCKQILCHAYYDTYKNMTIANEKVLESFPMTGPDESSRVGSCSIDPSENWWDIYFGSNPCTGG